MDEFIGKMAGDVWAYLDTHGPTTTLKLKYELDIPNSVLYLALGWLAREGKVQLARSGHAYEVSLKTP